MALPELALVNSVTSAGKADEEVHAVNTSGRIVLDTKVDVLRDTEAEVASGGEVALFEFVLLHLKTTLENLHSLLATNSHVHRDLFVTTDTEGTHGVAGYGREDEIELEAKDR